MKKKKTILCFMKMKNKVNKQEKTYKKEDSSDKLKRKEKKAETEYENTAADDYLDWLSDQW